MSRQTRRVEEEVGGTVDPQPSDLTAVVREVVADVAETYDCDIRTDLPEGATAVVSSSFPTAVEEVLVNAIEHSDRDHPTVEVSIEETHDGEYYQIRVTDDGPGIRDGQVAVIKGDVEHTQTQHLGGLGLWTARWVMQNTGGTIEFADNDPPGDGRDAARPVAGPRRPDPRRAGGDVVLLGRLATHRACTSTSPCSCDRIA
jgi:anti-sigma regulatory factor (Ser/Thr protein kinase)